MSELRKKTEKSLLRRRDREWEFQKTMDWWGRKTVTSHERRPQQQMSNLVTQQDSGALRD
jgi:hypothetical protein